MDLLVFSDATSHLIGRVAAGERVAKRHDDRRSSNGEVDIYSVRSVTQRSHQIRFLRSE